MSIKHTHILIDRGPITRKLSGGSDMSFFQRRITSIPESCGSVTCTLGEDHTAGRPASAVLAVVRWLSLRLQRRQIPAGDVADCWPRTQQCRLWTHRFMAALALMQHLIGRDELLLWQLGGPSPLYASPHSHCLHLIRSPMPLVYCVCVCVCTQSVSICTSASTFATTSVYLGAFVCASYVWKIMTHYLCN